MPRSVRVAIACALVLTLLGVAATACWATALLGESPDAGLRGLGSLGPTLAFALVFALRAGRREAQTRLLAFQIGLLAAFGLGFVLVAQVAAVWARGVSERSVLVTAAFALVVGFTWALSRPGAKGWFHA